MQTDVLSRPKDHFNPLSSFHSRLTASILHKGLLHLADLGLELLNLLPAVQRPAVVLPQAVPHIFARPLELRRRLLQLLAGLELGLQVHDFLLHAVVAAAGVWFRCGGGGLAGAVILVEGRGEVCSESVRVASCLLLRDGVWLDVGGEGCGEVGELLGAGVADAREFAVDAGLHLELEVLGTSAVGLFGWEIAVNQC